MKTPITRIGVLRSILKKKFGVPRQAGLVPEIPARIELLPPFNSEQLVRGLEGFSHIWVIFLFHQTIGKGWSNMVRPPRLGGKKRVGVFASRSPFRPNHIGMSAVALEGITFDKGRVILNIKGADIIDGTPVIDIKPYLPYSDSIEGAIGGYAAEAPPKSFPVTFSNEARERLLNEEKICGLDLISIVTQLLSQDPRPGYYNSKQYDTDFTIAINKLNVKWELLDDKILVTGVEGSE